MLVRIGYTYINPEHVEFVKVVHPAGNTTHRVLNVWCVSGKLYKYACPEAHVQALVEALSGEDGVTEYRPDDVTMED